MFGETINRFMKAGPKHGLKGSGDRENHNEGKGVVFFF